MAPKKNTKKSQEEKHEDEHVEEQEEAAPKSDSSKADMASMGNDGDDSMSETATKAAESRSEAIKQRAKEAAAKKVALANVKVDRKDIAMIADQMLVDEHRAESMLREHEGNVKAALKALYDAQFKDMQSSQ